MEYDIFRNELAIKYPAYGHALWDPSRDGLDSAVQVGDVGFTQYGKFIRLFNVLLPRDHPSHENFGVPEYHEPLKLKMSRHIYTGRLCPNNFCSKAVKPDRDEFSAAEPGPAQVTFSCSKKQGAILSLPVLAYREETFARRDFARCITKRIDVWFAFARHLGLGVAHMEDIILVTGRDLASSWTNVVFSENQGGEQVSFGVQVTGISSCNVQWQVPLEDIRGVAVNCGPSGQNLPEDQCIFVRGFRVRRRFMIIPRLRGAAEPTSDPDRDEADFDEQLISTPPETDYQDPLHTLLDYLVTNAPTDCDMALVHDDDLISIDVDPGAVLGNLQNSRPGIWWAQCAFAEGGSEVESSVAKVATFSCDVGAALSDCPGAWGAVGVLEGALVPSQIGPTSYQPVPRTWSLRRLIRTISRGLIQSNSRSKSPPSKGSVHLPTDDESQATRNLNVPSTTRKRRALLVGITYCSPSNTWDPLHGPFDDVERYRELFINTYGYRPEDVCVLKDDPDFPEHSQPTRANIIRELKKLVSGAASGDRFTFFYSGHSGQRPAVNDLEEEDGLDEMIIPSDERPIIDDELKAILVPIPVGCNLLAILDTCHSGTLLDLPHYHCNSVYVPWESKGKRRMMTRQIMNVRRQATDRDFTNSEAPRSIEATFDNQPVDPASRQNPPAGTQVRGLTNQSELSSESQCRSTRRSRDRTLFASQRRCASPEPRFVCDGWCKYSDVSHPNVLSLSACSDFQNAWEGPNSSLTSVLCNYLQTNNHPTYKELMLHINHKLHRNAMTLHHNAMILREHTHDQKKKAARGEGNGFDDDLDNFQEPELSSLVKLNMDDTLQL